MKLIISFLFLVAFFLLINTNHKIKADIINEEVLKIGVIVPLSGEYQEIGKSIINSLRMALNRIDNNKIEIFPRDNVADPNITLKVAKELEQIGVPIVIGPVFHDNLIYLNEIKNISFISLTNKTTDIPKNVISAGINAHSQFQTIINFLEKENLSKTIFLIPRSEHENEVKKNLTKIKHKFWKIYSYDINPDKLTKQIQQITKYKERKEDLRRRIALLENSNSFESKKKLEILKKKDTIGKVNFDSIIIADFDESLKSITTSFLYSDVDSAKIKFITLNQWFDDSLFKENSTNYIYFPSINYDKYNKFRETYFINFKTYPNKISIIAYDILGLIYYLNKKNKIKNKTNLFSKKTKFVGEIGNFRIENNKVNYQLELYQVNNNKFIKIN